MAEEENNCKNCNNLECIYKNGKVACSRYAKDEHPIRQCQWYSPKVLKQVKLSSEELFKAKDVANGVRFTVKSLFDKPKRISVEDYAEERAERFAEIFNKQIAEIQDEDTRNTIAFCFFNGYMNALNDIKDGRIRNKGQL